MNSIKITIDFSSSNGNVSFTFIEDIKYSNKRKCHNEEYNLYSLPEFEDKIEERLHYVKNIIEEFSQAVKNK